MEQGHDAVKSEGETAFWPFWALHATEPTSREGVTLSGRMTDDNYQWGIGGCDITGVRKNMSGTQRTH